MSKLLPLLVSHKEKGEGWVVDRLSHFNEKKEGFVIQLGVAYLDEAYATPAVHYENPSDVELLGVYDSVLDAEEEEEEEISEGTTSESEGEEHA